MKPCVYRQANSYLQASSLFLVHESAYQTALLGGSLQTPAAKGCVLPPTGKDTNKFVLIKGEELRPSGWTCEVRTQQKCFSAALGPRACPGKGSLTGKTKWKWAQLRRGLKSSQPYKSPCLLATRTVWGRAAGERRPDLS